MAIPVITERLANHTEQAHHATFKNQTGWHGEVGTLQDFGVFWAIRNEGQSRGRSHGRPRDLKRV